MSSTVNSFAGSFDSEINKMNTGYSAWALSMGKVMSVDYEQMTLTVAPLTGTSHELESPPIPIVFPGAGRRHFLGSMPEVGDFALLGNVSQNSSGQGMGKLPICLAWFPAPWWMGRDWLPTTDIDPDSGVLETYEREQRLAGMVMKSRMKLRGVEPGHIVASSSQGSDMVLDESVTLANRRGNQIILRDQDQAIVMRSLNEFHTLSGTRVYSGMVQRDARLLPPEMFAHKADWQTRKMILLKESNKDSPYPEGYLTPASIYQKDPTTNKSEWNQDPKNRKLRGSMNPYAFLEWGDFIDEEGSRSHNMTGEAIYGGKSFFRVGVDAIKSSSITKKVINSVIDPSAKALTEYRIELSHNADGTLPVTEQTEGFDADRLPSSNKSKETQNQPYIEIVHGSVVGNDPYKEIELYGVPLAPQLFDKGELAPSLGSGIGKRLGEHAAFLYKITPISGNDPAWISINKEGKAFAHLTGGLDLNVEKEFHLASPSLVLHGDSISMKGKGTHKKSFGVELSSENGAVKIYGGGKSNEGLQTSRTEEGGSRESRQPSVHIEGQNNIMLKATTSVMIHANTLDLSKTKQIVMNSQADIELASGDKLSKTSSTMEQTSNKTFTQTANGGSALDGPAYSLNIPTLPPSGAVGQPQRVIEQKLGGTEHTIKMGNHDTEIKLGSHTTTIDGAGSIKDSVAKGINTVTLDNTGYRSVVGAGAASLTASTSSSIVAGGAVSSTAGGVNTLRGTSVILGAPGGSSAPGPVVTGGTRCPITGLPFSILTNCNTGVVTTP